MRISLFLLTLFFTTGCKEKHSELTGHWISTGYFEGKEFMTIDFERENMPSIHNELDTFNFYINFNKNSLAVGGAISFVSEIQDGYEFYTPHYESSIKITFKGDTLFVRGTEYNYYNGDFVKIDEKKSFYDELFIMTDVVGRLPAYRTGDSVLNLNKALFSNINIGKGKYDPPEFDSIRINVQDAYISINDIKEVVRRQKDALAETDKQKLKIFFNADSSISKEFLDRVITQLNRADSSLKIYRSSCDYKANKLYYRRLQ